MSLRERIYQHLESIVVKKTDIQTALSSLDAIAAEHAGELPGDLLHYLQRRSYEKAWAWMNDEKHIPRGTCGGKE